jgi:hypothetical protein
MYHLELKPKSYEFVFINLGGSMIKVKKKPVQKRKTAVKDEPESPSKKVKIENNGK